MAHYFLDTSAVVKRDVIEIGSPWVKSLVRARAAHTLYIARITAVEVTSAITRRQRAGSLSPAQAGAILGHVRRHLTQRYVIVEVTPALLAASMFLARSHGLRAYDAVQLAAALQVHHDHENAGIGPITLVSADQELNAAASTEGLAVVDPNAHP
jgi:predicted nucleic acid-binding protein